MPSAVLIINPIGSCFLAGTHDSLLPSGGLLAN